MQNKQCVGLAIRLVALLKRSHVADCFISSRHKSGPSALLVLVLVLVLPPTTILACLLRVLPPPLAPVDTVTMLRTHTIARSALVHRE
jgi:hypothetical protein